MANIVAENEMFFNQFEPKTANRFIMYIDGLPTYLIKAVSRPQLTQDSKVINHINVERYVKGKSRWGQVQLTLYDSISPSGAQAVIEWVRLHHESITGRDGYADFYKKDVIINGLGPVGDKVEEWILKGAFIVSANFGQHNYDSDEVMTIELTLQPDYCILNY